MQHDIVRLEPSAFPHLLAHIPNPPEQLFLRGSLPREGNMLLAVVGSRNYSNYGKSVTEHLIEGLRGFPITVVSGLALGIDSIAHEAALRARLQTIAVPGSGIDDRVLYPRRHHALARRIIEAGGGLLGEFDPLLSAAPWTFPQRNRIMAGISHATLVVEATERSGTLITARLAADFNRELLVVPGNIFSEGSKGPHLFLKLGATPVTTPEDILRALGIAYDAERERTEDDIAHLSHDAQLLFTLLKEPCDRDTLIRRANLETTRAAIALTELEIEGAIRELGGILSRTDTLFSIDTNSHP